MPSSSEEEETRRQKTEFRLNCNKIESNRKESSRTHESSSRAHMRKTQGTGYRGKATLSTIEAQNDNASTVSTTMEDDEDGNNKTKINGNLNLQFSSNANKFYLYFRDTQHSAKCWKSPPM